MSKAAFNAVLAANIKDNNNAFITPARHRTTLESLRDFIGWLAEVNVWTAINTFNGGTREPIASITGTGTVTITDARNNQKIAAGVTTVNFPASPTDGDWYRLKNISGATVTLNGNTRDLYTSSANTTRTLVNGATVLYIYHATDNVWYNF